MASVSLDGLPIRARPILPLRMGGVQRSPFGGSTQINRMGDRWRCRVTTSEIDIEPDWRRWFPLLVKAQRLGAILPLRPREFNVLAPGAPTVTVDIDGGRTITIEGATPGYPIRQGQPLNYFDADGQRYLDFASEQVIVGSDGTASIEIANLLRTPLTEGVAIDLATPAIEGWLIGEIPDEGEDESPFVLAQFEIEEKA